MTRRALPSKAARELDVKLRALGWILQGIDGNNHPVYRHEASGRRMHVPGTPSDYRSQRNVLATARRVTRTTEENQ